MLKYFAVQFFPFDGKFFLQYKLLENQIFAANKSIPRSVHLFRCISNQIILKRDKEQTRDKAELMVKCVVQKQRMGQNGLQIQKENK